MILFVRVWMLLGLWLLLACAGGVPGGGPATLRIQGSDTMFKLLQHSAAEFMSSHPNTAIYVEAGGTATGLQKLIDGEIDLCSASRTLRPDESMSIAAQHQVVGLSVLIAKDGLSIYLHPENPLQQLTLAQLKGLYNGSIRNWSEIGGADAAVVPVSRPPNSGTRRYFEERVLEGDSLASTTQLASTTSAVIAAVSANPNALGYGGMAYGPDLRHCAVEGVQPSEGSVRNDSYPLTRYLLLYTVGKPRGLSKAFVDWLLGAEGQQVVRESGYIPLWD